MPDTPRPDKTCAAPQCGKPAHDGWLCTTCLATIRRDLASIPELVADLHITISRQDRLSDPSGRSTERPLPLRIGPMEAKRDLADTLTSWADHIAGRRGATVRSRDITTVADWLLHHLGDVQDDPRAGDICDEIGYAVITAQRAVDKPLQHQYVGPCDVCGADLFAHPRARVVACRNEVCDAEYNVADRREWLLEKAEDQLLTATEMSRALPDLLPVSPDGRRRVLTAAMIRGYAHRGRLARHPPHPEKPREPLYRVGDLLEIVLAEPHAKAG